MVARNALKCLRRVVRHFRVKAGFSQHHADEPRHIGVALANQDAWRHGGGRLARRRQRCQRFRAFAGQRFLPFGKLKKESAARIGHGGEADLAAHLFDQRFGNIQTQPGAAFLTAVRRIGLRKFLKNPVLEVLRNARAAIQHLDAHPLGHAQHPHLHAAFRR